MKGSFGLGKAEDPVLTTDTNLNHELSDTSLNSSSEEYLLLQLRIFRATLIVSAIAVSITAILYGFTTSLSLLIGALSGVLYLRLLARSVWRIGKSSQALGKVQLLVPVLLVMVVTKLPHFDLFPAVIGFLLYKPSLIIQFWLESRSG